MKIRFFEEALDEWLKSISYYSEIDSNLADYFTKDISKAISDIKHFPHIGEKHIKYTFLRIKFCRNFPYQIIYHVPPRRKTIYIVAVAHQKRTPDYWKTRI